VPLALVQVYGESEHRLGLPLLEVPGGKGVKAAPSAGLSEPGKGSSAACEVPQARQPRSVDADGIGEAFRDAAEVVGNASAQICFRGVVVDREVDRAAERLADLVGSVAEQSLGESHPRAISYLLRAFDRMHCRVQAQEWIRLGLR
jgi:hypothetical protein